MEATNLIRPRGNRHRPRWLVRLAAVTLGLIPVMAVEAIARWWRPNDLGTAIEWIPMIDSPRPLWVRGAGTDGQNRMTIAAERSNYFYPQSFAIEKPVERKRMFVVGGSTVAGRPYATQTSMTAWLSLRLESRDDREWEVINVGGVSHAAYRLLPIVQELMQYQPDALTIYTGHNEFLEDRTYAAAAERSPLGRWVDQVAARSAAVAWSRRWWSGLPTVSTSTVAPEVDTRLDHAGGMARYVREDAWRRSVHVSFEATLRRIVAVTRAAGVPLILCVPASDLVDTPPFKSTLRDGDQALVPLVTTLRNPDAASSDRAGAAERILDRDPNHADALYFLGRHDLGSHSWDQAASRNARQRLIAARDHDVCPLRATTKIQDAVRDIASEKGLALVDTTTILNPPSRRWFADHVHPSIEGHQRIAEAIDAAMARMGLVGGTVDETQYRQAVANAWKSLPGEYFERGRQRLEGLRRWARIRGE